MTSYRTRDKAAALNAHTSGPDCAWLWDRSKRELVEMVLHLAAVSTEDGPDLALTSGTALERAKQEHRCLKLAGLI